MNFLEFAKKLYDVIGEGDSTAAFTRTLFSVMSVHDDKVFSRSEAAFRAYYTGRCSIAKIAREIFPHVSPPRFEAYLRLCGKQTELYAAFSDNFISVKPTNICVALSELFHMILYEAIRPNCQFLLADNKLMTAKQAAAILRVSERTVRQYIARGLLPYVKVRRAYLVKLSDVRFLTSTVKSNKL